MLFTHERVNSIYSGCVNFCYGFFISSVPNILYGSVQACTIRTNEAVCGYRFYDIINAYIAVFYLGIYPSAAEGRFTEGLKRRSNVRPSVNILIMWSAGNGDKIRNKKENSRAKVWSLQGSGDRKKRTDF